MKALIICKKDRSARLMANELQRRLSIREVKSEIWENCSFNEDSGRDVDLAIILGGDGSILRAARVFAKWGIPILGVNFGRVGFLSSIEPEQLLDNLDLLLKREYQLDGRIMLEASVIKNQEHCLVGPALNDLVIKVIVPRVIDFRLQIDNGPDLFMRGDGIICATPTGSTAYSLSAGGPVVDASLPVLVITPICPQLQVMPPMIVNADSLIDLEIRSDYPADLAVDGEVKISLDRGDMVRIRKSTVVAHIIRINSQSIGKSFVYKNEFPNNYDKKTLPSISVVGG